MKLPEYKDVVIGDIFKHVDGDNYIVFISYNTVINIAVVNNGYDIESIVFDSIVNNSKSCDPLEMFVDIYSYSYAGNIANYKVIKFNKIITDFIYDVIHATTKSEAKENNITLKTAIRIDSNNPKIGSFRIPLRHKPENDCYIYNKNICYNAFDLANVLYKYLNKKLFIYYENDEEKRYPIGEVITVNLDKGFINIEVFKGSRIQNILKSFPCYAKFDMDIIDEDCGKCRIFNGKRYKEHRIDKVKSVILEFENPFVFTDKYDRYSNDTREKVDISDVRKGLCIELNKGIREKIDIDSTNYRFRNNLKDIIG